MSQVLVINSGSSSFKYQLIDPQRGTVFASGLVEKIGAPAGAIGFVSHKNVDGSFENAETILDYRAGFNLMMTAFEEHGPQIDATNIVAVGHRIVQGGATYSGPTLIDDEVLWNIEALSDLAPLHNPPALLCVRVAQEFFPDQPHVAVFDTAFHQTIPAKHYTYAINPVLAEKYGIRRYGFHGTSHEYVAQKAAEFLGRDIAETNLITLHLGNGASVTAIKNGQSYNTSMGMTPLEGLVMGTRSGDIDPGVLFHLNRVADVNINDLDRILNRESGLYGMTGNGDMRDVQAMAAAGSEEARRALAVYYQRVKHYLGGYFATLNRVDGIVFTAGVGENSVETRAGIVNGLEHMGIVLDESRNSERSSESRLISADGSPIPVLVIPTNEELEIAKQALALTR